MIAVVPEFVQSVLKAEFPQKVTVPPITCVHWPDE